MKKVGIVTSNASFANNYGAVLQCYALCGQLRKWGFDPYVINYSYLTQGVEATTTSLVDRSLFSKIKYLFSHDVSWTQKVQYRMKRSDRQNMRDAFLQFCRTNLSFHSSEPVGYADLKRNPPGYDYYNSAHTAIKHEGGRKRKRSQSRDFMGGMLLLRT